MIQILIEDFLLGLKIGCSAAERENIQNVRVNLKLRLNSQAALTSDNLQDTVDYIEVITLLQQAAGTGSWKLLEAWGQGMSALIFKNFAKISEIEMSVHKDKICPHAKVGVRLEFKR